MDELTPRVNFLEGWEKNFGTFRSQHARDLIMSSDHPDMTMITALDERWASYEGHLATEEVIAASTESWKAGRKFEEQHQPLQIPRVWANDVPMNLADQIRVLLLRRAGCKDPLPLLGTKLVRGHWIPRCRLCNTISWTESGPLVDWLEEWADWLDSCALQEEAKDPVL